MQMRRGSRARAVAITCASMGRPASGCSTLGRREFIRLPWPAASITTSGWMAIEKLSHEHRLIPWARAPATCRHTFSLAEHGTNEGIRGETSCFSRSTVPDVLRDRRALAGRKMQAGLGTPPQDVLSVLRPFARNQVIDLLRI